MTFSLAFGCASLAIAGSVFVPKTSEEVTKWSPMSDTSFFIMEATLGLAMILWNFTPTT